MATTTLFTSYPGQFPSPTARFLCQSWWTCYSTRRNTWRNRSDALLATDQPISVFPIAICEALDPVITPEPGWKGRVPAWFGIPCRLGRVLLWLPIQENPGQYRQFSLLVLLPKEELPDAPPYIHLGSQFLLEYRARLRLDCSSLNSGGEIVLH